VRVASVAPIDYHSVNPLNAELNPNSPNFFAGYLNFAHDIRKTCIFRELSGINL